MKKKNTALLASLVLSSLATSLSSAEQITKDSLLDICPKVKIEKREIPSGALSIEINVPADETRLERLFQAWFVISGEDGKLALRLPVRIFEIEDVKRIYILGDREMLRNASIELDCKWPEPGRSSLDTLVLDLPSLLSLQADLAEQARAVPWGPEQDGVRIRLVSLGEGFRVGKPIPFRLEMKNVSDRVLGYDDQGVGSNNSFKVENGKGEEIPYIGGSSQTLGGGRPLKPGQTVELVGHFDVTDDYLVNEPGTYRVRFRGAGPAFGKVRFPESNVVEVQVGEGRPDPVRKAAGRLIDILPEDRWEIALYGSEIHLLCIRTRLKRDAYLISLLMEEKKLSGRQLKEYEFVGESNGRFVYIRESPAGDEIDKEWDGHRKAILTALEIIP